MHIEIGYLQQYIIMEMQNGCHSDISSIINLKT